MASSTTKPTPLGSVLVIGGCGFLGHHIVNLLLASPEYHPVRISVLDLSTTRNRRPVEDGVRYFDGDITALEDTTNMKTGKKVAGLTSVFAQARPDVVIHTASPAALSQSGSHDALYQKVNVDGTKCVIEACQQAGVTALVYTSSASVVSDNTASYDLIFADETYPICPREHQTEFYSWTKAEAELAVLAANRPSAHPGFLTCALRPAGIFGPSDVQLLPNYINLYTRAKRTNWQIGDNNNLFDFTYVVNVAHAHLLASRALLQTARLSTTPLSHERVDGEAFFITNDAPVPFWDFARMVWKAAGETRGTEHVWVLSRSVGMAIGGFLESLLGLVGRQPNLTTKQVKYACMTRYYDVSKAKQRLGYAPLVGLREGVEAGVKWFMENEGGPKTLGEKTK